MKLEHLQRKIGGAILGLSIIFGVGAALGPTVQAQDRDRDGQYRRERERDRDRNRDYDRGGRRRGRGGDDYPNYGGSFQLRQTALNAGYNEGIKEGRNDRRKGRSYEFRNSSSYQKATKDYNSRDGDRELYRQYFRMAFENGYDAGYNGY